MTEQNSQWFRCPNCNSVMVRLDPPVEVEESEPCGVRHPELGSRCHLFDCHDGPHTHFEKQMILTWNDNDEFRI
jgi:hypothetical protein